MNDIDKHSQNYGIIKEFCDDNNIKAISKYYTKFNGYIKYSSKLASPEGEAVVEIKLKGYECEGDIEIIGDNFNSNQVHTGLMAKCQTYSYNKANKELIITGISQTIGNYKVTIIKAD